MPQLLASVLVPILTTVLPATLSASAVGTLALGASRTSTAVARFMK